MACLMGMQAFASMPAENGKKDWAQYERYAAANKGLTKAPEAVFMGNSITDSWYSFRPDFFNSNNFAGRGISGQVTSQMLCRFRPDVIDLKPKVVVILGGVNDLAGNNGYIEIPYIVDNVASMIDLARANGIIPLVGTCLPSNYAFWRPQLEGLADMIKAYNKELLAMCAEKGVDVIDYYTPMVDADGGIKAEYSEDRLHPNTHGYATVMEPLVLEAIRKATEGGASRK